MKQKKRTIERTNEIYLENREFCLLYSSNREIEIKAEKWGHLCPMDTFLAYLV